MDAYVFAAGATAEAVDRLGALVEEGTARVMVPLLGGRAVYVATTGRNARELRARLDVVTGVAGLTAVDTFLAALPEVEVQQVTSLSQTTGHRGAHYPTYAAVDAVVGFALLVCRPGMQATVFGGASLVPGVVGAAPVSGAEADVLVEATGGSVEEVLRVLDRAAGVPGVGSVTTAVGEAALGTGLNRS